ncbi:hypothetical protein lerEdw1_009985 [Lerista edwardsae]|nr:hypothetical protein lerEdw1_009985 [Lerista edwardsae]
MDGSGCQVRWPICLRLPDSGMYCRCRSSPASKRDEGTGWRPGAVSLTGLSSLSCLPTRLHCLLPKNSHAESVRLSVRLCSKLHQVLPTL